MSDARPRIHASASLGGGAFVHESAYVDEGASIGEGTRVWHFSHVGARAQIGAGCSIGQNVFVADDVPIGDHCKIQNNVSVYAGVELDDYVFCGPSMVFTNVATPRSAFPRRGAEHYARTRVGRGASIGANATVVCGHDIGAWSFIGAGAVVTSDVPAFALMLGVPARRAGWACACGQVLPESLACASCERRYQLEGNTLELTVGELP